jgi:hypothetical protein
MLADMISDMPDTRSADVFPDTLTLAYSFGGASADAPLVSRRVVVDVRGATCIQDAFLQRTDALIADVLEVLDTSLCTFVSSGASDAHALDVCAAALHYAAHVILRACPSILYVKLLERAAALAPWVSADFLAPALHVIEQAKTIVTAASSTITQHK